MEDVLAAGSRNNSLLNLLIPNFLLWELRGTYIAALEIELE